MTFKRLALLLLFTIPMVIHSQTQAELARILFPDDPNLQEVMNMMQDVLTKQKMKRFYEITESTEPGKTKISKETRWIDLSGKYEDLRLELESNRFSEIVLFSLYGKNLKLFGSTKQENHLEALQEYPDL